MKVMVFGGAGYIGSHACKALEEQGHEVIVYDNLATGHIDAINCRIYPYNILDIERLDHTIGSQEPDAVMFFAAMSIVPESFEMVHEYWTNNLVGFMNVVNASIIHGVRNIVFSSTAAVYSPSKKRLREMDATKPLTPYGASKLACEMYLANMTYQHDDLNATVFRYFNVAGSDPDGKIGESHFPETHLIPNLIRSLQTGERFNLFGNDHPTADGTAVRDYIHVCDLVDAHITAMVKNDTSDPVPGIFNLGSQHGTSVRQLMNIVESVMGKRFESVNSKHARRGDPPHLVCDCTRAVSLLDFKRKYNIKDMVEHAMLWQNNRKY